MSVAASKTIIRAVVPKTVVATVDRMARASGKSRSAVVSEFLVEVEPALRRLAGMLEVAKAQQSLFPKSQLAELEAALDGLSGNVVDVMDRVQGTLDLAAKARDAGSGADARSERSEHRARPRRRRRTPVQ